MFNSALGISLTKITQNITKKHHPYFLNLIDNWFKIAPKNISSLCQPSKLSKSNILYLSIEPGSNLDIYFNIENIKQSINLWFGKEVVKKIIPIEQ